MIKNNIAPGIISYALERNDNSNHFWESFHKKYPNRITKSSIQNYIIKLIFY